EREAMSSSSTNRGRTTTSVEGILTFDVVSDPTPGLALVYSRLHPHLPSAVPFAIPVVTFGREADNTLSIPEAAVSRHHARFERRSDGKVWVIDAPSMNGTYVNGRRVAERSLAEHDVLRIGDTLFRYVERGIYGYGAYRIDGGVVRQARPFTHGVEEPYLIGGYQVDAVIDRIAKVAKSEHISVVVTGESGTGKELVAREIHRLSGRKGAFQAINCAALPENLIESELFGYRRGAFSGAVSDKLGLVRAAHGGTLFLDEIGDMPLEAQSKLLRVLQEKEVTPLGATTAERVDLRVVCATHRDLEANVASGTFRGDLLARLRDLSVRLPPLRERREDLYPLVLHFLAKLGLSSQSVSFPFMFAIAHYDWPYNVRELESAVRVAVTLSGGAPLDVQHLPDATRGALEGLGAAIPGSIVQTAPTRTTLRDHNDLAPAAPLTPHPVMDRAERREGRPSENELRALLVFHHGNIAAVGHALGKHRMQVHRWLRHYGIDIKDFRPH
ncbi:MAG: Type fimbriae expression regulatory protein PilR, partial [Myxococcaceae bacterium]|nr:Type fimbriae expression regulatory protein PilR [Myxococcaceae bacterium]